MRTRFSTPFCTLFTAAEKPKRSKVQPTPEDFKCLVRASDGKRKVSTVLAGKDLSRFQDSYQTILKVRACLDGVVYSVFIYSTLLLKAF